MLFQIVFWPSRHHGRATETLSQQNQIRHFCLRISVQGWISYWDQSIPGERMERLQAHCLTNSRSLFHQFIKSTQPLSTGFQIWMRFFVETSFLAFWTVFYLCWADRGENTGFSSNNPSDRSKVAPCDGWLQSILIFNDKKSIPVFWCRRLEIVRFWSYPFVGGRPSSWVSPWWLSWWSVAECHSPWCKSETESDYTLAPFWNSELKSPAGWERPTVLLTLRWFMIDPNRNWSQ